MANKKGYSSVRPIVNPDNNVLKAVYDLKLPKGMELIPIPKLHCTLMYDERNPDIKVEVPPVVYHTSVVGVAVLGKAVVLLLASNELMKRHLELQDAGFKYSFDNYPPHMSILYAETDAAKEKLDEVRDQVQTLLTDKKLPSDLYFTDEHWTECE